jgi:hypothetical protein
VTSCFHYSYNNSGITAYDRPITARQDTKVYFLESADSI